LRLRQLGRVRVQGVPTVITIDRLMHLAGVCAAAWHHDEGSDTRKCRWPDAVLKLGSELAQLAIEQQGQATIIQQALAEYFFASEDKRLHWAGPQQQEGDQLFAAARRSMLNLL